MKSRLLYYLLPLLVISLFSCTKEVSRENGQPTGVSNGDFYATIDGNPWEADSLQLVDATADGVTINGLSKTGAQISMILPEFKVGTYTLNKLSVSYSLYANLLDNVASVFVSNEGTAGGTVTISIIDTIRQVVSGTFQFNLVNPADNSTKEVTKGVFNNIPYAGGSGGVIIPPPTGGGNLDTLQATVDGTKFVGAQVQATINSTAGGDQLLLAGISSTGAPAIALLMPANVAPGTYTMDFSTGQYIGIYYPSSSVAMVSQANGLLTIISNDTVAKRIIGTFSFIANPASSGTPVNITEGYFAISY